ncbi:MAG TPA: tetratricopeptide repeat protein [Caldimonas sp.]|nr:tetratricopeptide repeat protein [Caldimonas sp.]HEX2541335.1 tetratricopeptide repeat protein [Caldimonas sp.]
MTVCLRLLGSPTLEHAGELRPLAFERRNQLLAYLALKQSWVTRAELAHLLWPELEDRLAYTNLRKILFRLQALPWSDRIETQVGALRFQVATDVVDFETALREQRLADALALRRGEVLAGFDDDANEAWTSWLGFERDRLRVAWRQAALERLGADIDPAEGVELSARLLESDPLDEAALRRHMAWLGRSGQAAQGRLAYRDFVARLRSELGMAPSAELAALHDSLGTASAPLPPAATAKARGPVEDGFVGRQVELRRIAARLAQDDCRLLCLTGPGGIGKTRLAQRALHELAPAFADGAFFIPLEDVADAAELAARLAREIDVRPAGGRDLLEQVIDALRGREMLLVLDNFEQLAAAAPVLQTLLEACPRLKLLVTSRVRLGIALEWLLPLEGLPSPELEDADRIEAFDAVRLFVNAAHRVEPALIASSEAAAIVEICALVEGLPLALELAAAWTRVLSCQSIAAELRLGTELLRADDAGRPARHASVDVVFDHSWQLLSPAEREALARLSVFRGGFSADAARAVAGASLPVLGALADKSLLRKEGDRIHLHPLVQQLASARLGDGDARASAEEAHASHFHRMLRQLREPTEKGEREALRQVETEFENCRVAWRWAAQHGSAQLLRKSAEAMVQYCDYQGRLDAAMGLVGEALEALAEPADPSLEALLLSKTAHLHYRLNRYGEAQADAHRALALAGSRGDVETRLTCLKVLGGCNLRLGRHAEAKRHYRQALQLGPAHTNPRNAATMTDHLALVEKATGDYDAALRLTLDALAQHRRIGDAGAEALCLNNLGALYLDREEYESARAHVREALAICDRHGIASTRAYLLANLAEIAVNTEDNAAAEAYAAQALQLAEATANRAVACWMRLQTARLAARRRDLAAARGELAAALTLASAIGIPNLLQSGTIVLAEVLKAQGEPHCGRRLLTLLAALPDLHPQLRRPLQRSLDAWEPAAAEPAQPGHSLSLEEVVHRAVVEAPLAHAPLIAVLRAGR